jgi:hypothetical protein
MKNVHWARLLAYVSGLVNQKLLLKNEYLAIENRILRAHIEGRLLLLDPELATLAEIGKRLGRKALEQIACVAKPRHNSRLVSEAGDRARRRGGSNMTVCP